MKLEASFQKALKGESSNDSLSMAPSNIPTAPHRKSNYFMSDNDNDNNNSTYSDNRDTSDIYDNTNHPKQQVASSSTADRARIKGGGIMNLYKNPFDNSSDVKAANQKVEYAMQLQQQIEEKKQSKMNELKTYIDSHSGSRLSSQQAYPNSALSLPSNVEIVDQTFSPGFDPRRLPPPSQSLLHDMYGHAPPAPDRGGFVLGKDEAAERAMRRERQDVYRRQLDEIAIANNAMKASSSNSSNPSSSHAGVQSLQHPSRQSAANCDDKASRRRQQDEYRRTLDAQLADKKSVALASDSSSRARQGSDMPLHGEYSAQLAMPPPLSLRDDFAYENQFQQQQQHGGYTQAEAYPPPECASTHHEGGAGSPHRNHPQADPRGSAGNGVKSPTKARIRLISDVYGSSSMLGHDATVIKDSWRPSMGPSDDRRRAAMSEQRQVLEAQIADTRRRRDEEAQRLKRVDEEEERRVRAELLVLGEEEQAARSGRRQRAHEDSNALRALQEKRAEDIKARKKAANIGGGPGESSPPRTTPAKKAPAPSPNPYPNPALDAGHHSSTAHARPHAPVTYNMARQDLSGYQHSSGSGRQQLDMSAMSTSYANPYEDSRRSYDRGYGDVNVSHDPRFASQHTHPYRARSSGAEQEDSFLEDWQRRMSNPSSDLAASLSSSMLQAMSMQQQAMSMQQQQQAEALMAMQRRSLEPFASLSNNVSFVSDSRLVSANPYDSFGLLASMQPPPQPRPSSDAAPHSRAPQAFARQSYNSDMLEQSLASDSLLTFIGGAATPHATPKVMSQQLAALPEHEPASPMGSPLTKLVQQSSRSATSVKASVGSSADAGDSTINFSRPVQTRDSIDSMIASRPLSTKNSSSNIVTSSAAYSLDGDHEEHEEELHVVQRISPDKTDRLSPYVSQAMLGFGAGADYENDNFDDEGELDWKPRE